MLELPLGQVLPDFLTSLCLVLSHEVLTCLKCKNETKGATFDSIPKKENIWRLGYMPCCISDLPDTCARSNSLLLILNPLFSVLLSNVEVVSCRHFSLAAVSVLSLVTKKGWIGATAGRKGFLLPVCCFKVIIVSKSA